MDRAEVQALLARTSYLIAASKKLVREFHERLAHPGVRPAESAELPTIRQAA